MNTSTITLSPFRKLSETLGLMLRRPPRMQVAALCYREGKSGSEILLVTSRKNNRLMIPKGWPSTELSDPMTAQKEAFEEAGIVGDANAEPIGEYDSKKGMGQGFKIKTKIIVYPLKFQSQTNRFPELGQRETHWLPLDTAIERCEVSGLKKMLQKTEVKNLLNV